MTIHWLDYAIIILYFFVVVYIGYWAMKKVTNFDDYAVAGRISCRTEQHSLRCAG